MVVDKQDKVLAFLGILLGAIGFIIILLIDQKSKYALFYGKQGLILTGGYIIMLLVHKLPLVGDVLFLILEIGLTILWIIGMIFTFSGEEKDIPLIGKFARKIKFDSL